MTKPLIPMQTEFIYWRHHTPVGIKIEEISGGEDKKNPLWKEMAFQLYGENGRDEYREIGHFASGAPFLRGSDQRISISHTRNMLVVATLPPTPDSDLKSFSPEAALGVDVEEADRNQVLRIRSRFLNDDELRMITDTDVLANITAWTAKEALYKAAMSPDPYFRKSIRILHLPEPVEEEKWLKYISSNAKPDISAAFGSASVALSDGSVVRFNLYSYLSGPFVVTLAFSDLTATYND